MDSTMEGCFLLMHLSVASSRSFGVSCPGCIGLPGGLRPSLTSASVKTFGLLGAHFANVGSIDDHSDEIVREEWQRHSNSDHGQESPNQSLNEDVTDVERADELVSFHNPSLLVRL